MTPQEIAKSIADELREHPERWTQGAIAKDSNGVEVGHSSVNATCWCLEGLIYKHGGYIGFGKICRAFDAALGMDIRPCDFNDSAGRTVADVIALCDKVAAQP